MSGTLLPNIGYGKAARFMYIATVGQVTFNGPDSSPATLTCKYTPGYVEVIVNGDWLPPQDYTATDGSSIVLGTGCVAGDIVYVYALSTFTANITPFTSPGVLKGMIMSTAGASTTLTVSAGSCADSTDSQMMKTAAPIAKTTAAWALGTTNGGLDTGSIAASTWYHWFAIYNPTTAVTDILFSLSPTAPTMPSGFTLFRRIGSMRINGSSQWTLFRQFGDEFLWDVPVLDVNTAVLGTTSTLFPLALVPSGIQTIARLRGFFSPLAAGTLCLIHSGDDTAQVANVPNGNITVDSGAASVAVGTTYTIDIRVNTSQQIRAVSTAASTTFQVVTYGWIDQRGKLF